MNEYIVTITIVLANDRKVKRVKIFPARNEFDAVSIVKNAYAGFFIVDCSAKLNKC